MADDGSMLSPETSLRAEARAPDPGLGDPSLDRAILGLTVAIWSLHAAHVVLRAYISDFSFEIGVFTARMATTVTAIVITTFVWAALRRLKPRGLRSHLAGAMCLSIIACVAVTLANETFMDLWSLAYDLQPERYLDPVELVTTYLAFLWIFMTWSGICATIAAGSALRLQERRAAAAEALAQRGQLSALRHQLQPHFVFNALNAISALVHARKNEQAEKTVLQLARFLEHTLTLAPSELLPLGKEINAQRLYLEIEKVRFSHRLIVDLDVEDSTIDALVPSLILQPLVENAIKHGLARSTCPVTITIGAAHRADLLHIWVQDDSDVQPNPAGGFKVGLENVHQRLALLYGDHSYFKSGATQPGWRSEIFIPFQRSQ